MTETPTLVVSDLAVVRLSFSIPKVVLLVLSAAPGVTVVVDGVVLLLFSVITCEIYQ